MPNTRANRRTAVRRRVRTVPTVFGMFVAGVVTAPISLAVAAGIDCIRWVVRRRPWMSVRLLAFGMLYLAAESAGIIAMAAIWVATGGGRLRRPFTDATYSVQLRWAVVLLGGARRLFRIDFQVEGLADVAPGPIIVLARHASIVDNLIPAVFITKEAGVRLRYILKKELLGDPCLDIAGNRLPNYFVDRSAENPRRELEAIAALATDLGPRDGVLIFPEGTRFTTDRRERALAKLEDGNSSWLERAQSLRHVLPPKPGGISSLLNAAPGADVVLLAHRGLEGFARVDDLWQGGMVGRTVHVRFWRVPSTELPGSRPARAEWLFDQWERIDRWIAQADDGTRA